MSHQEWLACLTHESKISDIFTITLSIVFTLIALLIAVQAIKKLPKHPKILNIFKYLFYCQLFFVLTCTIVPIISTITCLYGYSIITLIFNSIHIVAYGIVVLVLLTTLLARLHFTFIGSMYEIQDNFKIILIIWYSLIVIITIFNIALFVYTNAVAFENMTLYRLKQARFYLSIIDMILYIGISILANVIFAKKLLHLSGLRTNSYRTVLQEDNEDIQMSDRKLNERQIKLLENITRYISLFSIAIISTVFIEILLFWGKESNWSEAAYVASILMASFDCVVNIVCLWFSYSFNKHHYKLYCKLIDNCWAPYVKKIAKSNMQETYDRIRIESNKQSKAVEMTSMVKNDTSQTAKTQ
eukprot:198784_1